MTPDPPDARHADAVPTAIRPGADILECADLMDAVPDAIYVFDLVHRRPVFVNRAAHRLLGFDPARILALGGGFVEAVIHEDDADRWGAHMAGMLALADGETAVLEYRFHHEDRGWRWFESRDAVFARDDEGRVTQLLGVATDVTERKQAAEIAARRAEQLQLVFASIDEGFCVCEMLLDEIGQAVDYRFVEVNPLFEEMTGLSGAVGRTALELVPDLEPVWIETYARVALGRESLRFEQGSEAMGRWFDVFAMPLPPAGRFGIVFKDRSESKRAEVALREAADLDHFRAELSDALRPIVDPVEVQAVAAHLLGGHLGAARVHYIEIGSELGMGTIHADFHPGAESMVGRHRIDHYAAIIVESVLAGRTLTIHDVTQDPRLSDRERAATRGRDVGAYVVVPLVKAGLPTAVLVVQHHEAHAWTPEEERLVQETADRTWACVERARTEQALRDNEAAERRGRRRAEDVAGLMTALLTAMGGTDGLDRLGSRLVEFLVRDVADRAELRLTGLPTPIVAGRPRDAGATPPIPLEGSPRSRGRAPRQVEVTLSLGQRPDGTLLVERLDPGRPGFTPGEVAFIEDVAERAALVLARARLREDEHDISQRLQRALLPDSLREHPDLRVHAHYAAASDLMEVGGDWYDTFTWPSGHYGIVVGDVVGHDLQAAAAMGRLRAGLGALAAQTPPSPAALLQALERCTNGPDGTHFVTAAVVVVDPATGVLRYASAGHPPPLLVTPGQPPVWLDQATSPPLPGLEPDTSREESEILLEPGSTVVLYSDGLIERRGENLDLGLGRLEAAAERAVTRTDPAPDLARELAETLTADAVAVDDIVVVTLRYTPAGREVPAVPRGTAST